MTYEVEYEEHNLYVLTFDSKEQFEDWENLGSCISDLNQANISICKTHLSCIPMEDDE